MAQQSVFELDRSDDVRAHQRHAQSSPSPSSSVEALAMSRPRHHSEQRARSRAVASPHSRLPHNTLDFQETASNKSSPTARRRANPQVLSTRAESGDVSRQSDLPRLFKPTYARNPRRVPPVARGETSRSAIDVDAGDNDSGESSSDSPHLPRSPSRRSSPEQSKSPLTLQPEAVTSRSYSVSKRRRLALESAKDFETTGSTGRWYSKSAGRDGEGDSSTDPMDLLDNTNDPKPPRGFEVSRASKMAGRAKSNSLGKTPEHTLLNPNAARLRKAKSPQMMTISLEGFVVGNVGAIFAESSPRISFSADSKKFGLQTSDREVDLDMGDFSTLKMLRADTTVGESLMAVLELRANTRSAGAIKNLFENSGSFSEIRDIEIEAREDQRLHWLQFVRCLRSALRGKVQVLDSSGMTSLKKLFHSAVEASQFKRRASGGDDPAFSDLQSTRGAPVTAQRRLKRVPLPLECPDGLDRTAVQSAGALSEGSSPSQRARLQNVDKAGSARVMPLENQRESRVSSPSHARPRLEDGARRLEEQKTTTEAVRKVEDLLILRYPDQGPGCVQIFKSDRERLAEGEFLNDTIIEFGLKWHLEQTRELNQPLYNSIYVFNTFFYKQLTKSRKDPDANYQQVRKWTARTDIFSKRFLVLPINENVHWYLAIVLNPGKALEGVDGSTTLSPAREDAVREAAGSPANDSDLQTPELPGPEIDREDRTIPMEESYRAMQLHDESQDSSAEAVPKERPNRITTYGKSIHMSASQPRKAGALVQPTQEESMTEESHARSVSQSPKNSITTSSSASCLFDSDIEMTDPSSNISNAGRGVLEGGGEEARAKRRPCPITPGESFHRPGQSAAPTSLRSPVSVSEPSHLSTSDRPHPSSTAISPVDFYGRTDKSREGRNSAAREMSDSDSVIRHGFAKVNAIDVDSDTVDGVLSVLPLSKPSKRSQKNSLLDAQHLQGLVVLTFDSLGGKHTAVRTAVNHYLRNEALDKKLVHIKPEAQYINVAVPAQHNFCDCGLFVLLYFETFLRNFDRLITEIIPSRNADDPVWQAESARSARTRLRTLIDELSDKWLGARRSERARSQDSSSSPSRRSSIDERPSSNGEITSTPHLQPLQSEEAE